MANLLKKVVLACLKAPLYALYGAFFAVRAVFRLAGEAGDGAALLRSTLPCPSCRTANALHGRWKCRGCSAIYHGFVARCRWCTAGATFFSCRRCGVSIPLRRLP